MQDINSSKYFNNNHTDVGASEPKDGLKAISFWLIFWEHEVVMMVLMSVTEARLKTHCAETKIFTKLYTQLSKLCNKLKIYFIFERRENNTNLDLSFG